MVQFLLNFIEDFQNFHQVFPNILPFFFQNSINITQNWYFSLSFAVFSRQFLSPLLIFYQVFCKFLKFFFKDLLKSFDKLTDEINPNFYFDLLKNFLLSFQIIFKFFFDIQIIFKFSFDIQIIFFKKLIVSNFFYLNILLCFIKLFIKIPVISKFINLKVTFNQNFLNIFPTFFSFSFFEFW